MILLYATFAAAAVFGLLLPLRWGIWGFLAACLVLLVAQVTTRTLTGFAGESVEDSLLLFNGSYLTFVGFNVQVTYRAIAGPLLVLSALFIFRLARAQRA